MTDSLIVYIVVRRNIHFHETPVVDMCKTLDEAKQATLANFPDPKPDRKWICDDDHHLWYSHDPEYGDTWTIHEWDLSEYAEQP